MVRVDWFPGYGLNDGYQLTIGNSRRHVGVVILK